MASGTEATGRPGRARAGGADDGADPDEGADPRDGASLRDGVGLRDSAGLRDGADRYDVLILDAGYKQSLLCARSLGRAGLRVALAESAANARPRATPPSFRSRYCSRRVLLPSHVTDAAAFAGAIVDFVRAHPAAVVIPMGDATIAATAPARERLAGLGCFLALAPAPALETANDKDRTLRDRRRARHRGAPLGEHRQRGRPNGRGGGVRLPVRPQAHDVLDRELRPARRPG